MNTLHYITVATKPHPVLDKLKERLQKNNENIIVLGEQENRVIGWENQQRFGVKLREVSDFLKQTDLNPLDLILFTDAYDVAYFGNLEDVRERYLKFNCPIVFGCEKECHPDPNRASQYNKKDVEFPYLNSGMFIGTVDALRKCIINYKYNDTDDDQRYWTTQYFENPDLITLDYNNEIFLNTSGYDEKYFMFDIENNISFYKHMNPIFVHVNGPDKSFANDLVGISNTISSDTVTIIEKDTTKFDVVILLGPNDKKIINDQIKHTKKNVIGFENIYIISCDPTIQIDGCITIDEKIFPFSKQTVIDIMGVNVRNGWYYQQLLKLYAFITIPQLKERFLIIDADTFFVRPTQFICPETNKPFYGYVKDGHEDYYEHMLKLHPSFVKVDEDKSGVCHHMMFEKKYLTEIFTLVENFHSAKPLYKVFLECVEPKNYAYSGASEYEIYFNYILQFHPNEILLRTMKWEDIINWVNIIDWDQLIKTEKNLDYDFVSYHFHLQKEFHMREIYMKQQMSKRKPNKFGMKFS
jgi:Family of unknown function (DUF6492)